MKFIATLFSLLFLSGCFGTSNVYNPNKIEDSNLATISIVRSWLNPAIIGVSDDNKKQIILSGNFFSSGFATIKLESGTYTLFGSCTNGNRIANPSIKISVKNGGNYELYCIGTTAKDFWGDDVYSKGAFQIKEVPSVDEMMKRKEWTVGIAKAELKEGNISSAQYRDIISHLRKKLNVKINKLKEEYRNGGITREDYDKKVKDLKTEYYES